jgi:broad specificity phosphatase PhoE
MGAERAGEIVVVAHGGTLRMLNAYLRGIPVERMSGSRSRTDASCGRRQAGRPVCGH